jgi:cytochrome b561
MMIILIAVFLIGWVTAAAIGTQAYFLGEQTKPIHERNWNSDKFEKVAQAVTGKETDYSDRIPAYSMDAYASNSLSS